MSDGKGEDMRSYKKALAFTLCVFFCICMIGCGKDDNEEALMNPIISTSTDLKLVERLFPSLEGAVSLEMEQLKYGGSEGTDKLPGPTDYIYRGYIVLSDEKAGLYTNTYNFTATEAKVPFESIKERAGNWKYSYDFNKEIIPAGYVGTVWIDGNTLLFDFGTM